MNKAFVFHTLKGGDLCPQAAQQNKIKNNKNKIKISAYTWQMVLYKITCIAFKVYISSFYAFPWN